MTQILNSKCSLKTHEDTKTSLLKNEQNNTEPKFIRIQIEDQTQIIFLPDTSITCGWLLNHVKNLTTQKIIAIRTQAQNETFDYYLTQLER